MNSENAECTTVGKDSTNEDTENANNNANSTASSPVDKSQTECQTVSNNNWWGSWISSAKTKVYFDIPNENHGQSIRITYVLMIFSLLNLTFFL